MFRSVAGFALFPLLQAYFPPFRIIVRGAHVSPFPITYRVPQPDSRTRRIARAQKVMRRIGLQLVEEKKAEIMKAASAGEKGDDTLHSRDLLTLLIKANMATDIPENQRLSDEDVLARKCPRLRGSNA